MVIFHYIISGFLIGFPLLCGIVLAFFPPKKINAIYGYRSELTMEDQSTWDYGQKICGRMLLLTSTGGMLIFVLPVIIFNRFFVDFPYLMSIFGTILLAAELVITLIVSSKKTFEFSIKKYFAEKAAEAEKQADGQ